MIAIACVSHSIRPISSRHEVKNVCLCVLYFYLKILIIYDAKDLWRFFQSLDTFFTPTCLRKFHSYYGNNWSMPASEERGKIIRHQFLVSAASNLLERNFPNFSFDNRTVIKPESLFRRRRKGAGTPTRNNWLWTEENFNVKCLMFLITERSTHRHERKYSKITKYLKAFDNYFLQ